MNVVILVFILPFIRMCRPGSGQGNLWASCGDATIQMATIIVYTTYNKSPGMDSNMLGNYIRNWNYIVFVSSAKLLSFTVKKVTLK